MIDAFLVTGLPGSGKTTVSRALAQLFPLSACIEADVLSFDFVVRGLPDPFADEGDGRQWDRHMAIRAKNTCMLARSFLDEGFVTVIDDFVVRLEDVTYRANSIERPLGLVVLAPPLDTIAARDASRDKQVFAAWEHKDAEMRAELSGQGVWIESAVLAPEEIAAAIAADPDAALFRSRGLHA